MSPSEIAFLALGIVLGAGIGAAIVEAVRARPRPRREVRITVSPNSIAPRRPATLASTDHDAGHGLIPGSPDDDDWLERRLAGDSAPSPPRTRVPSGPVSLPSSAVGVPVEGRVPAGRRVETQDMPGPGSGPGPASASAGRNGAATAILERVAAPATAPVLGIVDLVRPGATMTRLDVGSTTPGVAVRPRVPSPNVPTTLAPTVVPIVVRRDLPDTDLPDTPIARAPRRDADPPAGGAASGGAALGGASPTDSPAAAEPVLPAGSAVCESERTLVRERCALAEAAREQARLAADALRDAQRAYDVLRERVDQAHAIADPRELRAAKDALHRSFRAARAGATTSEAAENAAREWLNEINRLNTAAREAARVMEGGSADLRSQLPRLERLAVEADAARITAESAEEGCREAREALARCEERAAAAARARQPAPEQPTARDLAWPAEDMAPRPAGQPPAGQPPPEEGISELSAIVRILRGDRQARERLVASLAGGDPEAARQWQIRIAELVDAITARAIEDGFLDLPDDGFWGLFTSRERREIVAALSALGFRFDGLGAFADGRVPAPRDLSLAVGYAGLDRMRIRSWPREAELPGLYAGASVAADEWLANEAVDLSLGRMVDALGARAAELADVWNAWGRVRPGLLAID